jgi:hypothetical protein
VLDNRHKNGLRTKRENFIHEHIQYYQKIIVALAETDRLMKEIDKIEI